MYMEVQHEASALKRVCVWAKRKRTFFSLFVSYCALIRVRVLHILSTRACMCQHLATTRERENKGKIRCVRHILVHNITVH